MHFRVKHPKKIFLSVISLLILLVLNSFYGSKEEISIDAKEPAYNFYVKEIIDGDTIRVEGGESIRYIGINTPEAGEPFYKEAKDRNKALVKGKKVKVVVCEKEKRDKYGRLLGWIYADNVLVNEVLLREGLAKALIIPPCGSEKEAEFIRIEKEAKAKRFGIWKSEAEKYRHAISITPNEAGRHIGEIVTVKGMVTGVHKTKNAVFINFSNTNGFTAVIFKRKFREFESAGVDVMELKGKTVAISGVVSEYKGHTEIIMNEPAQFKILK